LESHEIDDLRLGDMRQRRLVVLEPFIAIVGLDYLIALLLQHGVEQVPEGGILIHQHNPRHAACLHAGSLGEASCATASTRPVSREVVWGLNACMACQASAIEVV